MHTLVDWVLRTFGTQIIKKKLPVRPVFPEYIFVSYDYGLSEKYFKSFPNLSQKICRVRRLRIELAT